MTMRLDPAMAEALRLTRAGDLPEATRLIQARLAGGTAGAPRADADVVDLAPTRVTVSSEPRTTNRWSGMSDNDAAGRFVERRHSGPEGVLDYRLYLPRGAVAGMPLVVMLHGCTQSPEDFARGTGMNRIADELGFVVAYPRQKTAANPNKCWNWFRPEDQRRDRGEPALIAGVTRQILADERANPRRVYVAGLSAGGAAAAVLAACYPDVYVAVGIHSGLAYGAAHDLPSALMAMKRGGGASAVRKGPNTGFVPVITFHGDRDRLVHAGNSREIIAAATAAARIPLMTLTETGRSGGGRRYAREVSADAEGRVLIEQWTVHGAGHAWSGGDAAGSHTDPTGPDASREMLRFFLDHEAALPAGVT